MKQKFCQSCGMPLTEDVLGTNADGSKNEDYCMYCYKDGKFLQECTMEEMIEHCAQFVNAVNEGLEKPITKEEYIGMMKSYFPQLKRWRQTLDVNNDEAMNANPALAGVKELIAQMADKLPIAYISSVDQEGFNQHILNTCGSIQGQSQGKHLFLRCQGLQGHDAQRYDGGADGCRLKRNDLARWRHRVLSWRRYRSQLLRVEVHSRRWPFLQRFLSA